MNIDWVEARAWITLLIAAIAGLIALRQYLVAQRQRRWENAFRLIQLFWESLDEDDLDRWREIFHASSEPAGAEPCKFVWIDKEGNHRQSGFEGLFTEGPSDGGATERMADAFEIIGRAIIENTADAKVVYHQLGQLMDSVWRWTGCVESAEGASLLEDQYPSLHKLYERRYVEPRKWHRKSYEHVG